MSDPIQPVVPQPAPERREKFRDDHKDKKPKALSAECDREND